MIDQFTCSSEKLSRMFHSLKICHLGNPEYEGLSPELASVLRQKGYGYYVDQFEAVQKEFSEVKLESDLLERKKYQMIVFSYKVTRGAWSSEELDESMDKISKFLDDFDKCIDHQKALHSHCVQLHSYYLKIKDKLACDNIY